MKKFLPLLLLPYVGHAAHIHQFWGKLPQSIAQQSIQKQLQFINTKSGHTRYQVTYKDIPVWGYHLSQHTKGKIPYSGYWVTGLDKDISSTTPKLTKDDVLKKLDLKQSKQLSIKKVIYMDGKKGKLAYYVKYFHFEKNGLTQPNKIIDANNGQLLKSFDSLHTKRVGQGPGGNYMRLPTRSGFFQYGQAVMDLDSLGRFDVTEKNGACIVGNNNFEIINYQNKGLDWDAFPVSVLEDNQYKPFSYPCNKQSQYINYDDGGYAPINEGVSPINDAMYFSQATIDMYDQFYGEDKPFGDDLPIRIYTHIASFDNAFAIETQYEAGKITAHQQAVLGNGEYYFTPMTQTTVPHELTHLVTNNNSALIYEHQSGGIDEAFSDMADLALRDYLSRLYPGYWDHKDWTIGREESLTGEALRYMEKPSDDGYSIDSASDYYEGLNVHFSSGVFNRAFYLLAHAEDWNVQKAFQVMFDANRYYWVPNTNFDFAACGVIQAAQDRGWDTWQVVDAFKQVAVNCPLL